jgi:uncharacterized membrane-anchored protein
MSMNLGYLVGTGIFAAIFLAAVIAQVKANGFHPILYWATIISTTTVGTTLADLRIVRSESGTLAVRACCWPCCSARSSSGIAPSAPYR